MTEHRSTRSTFPYKQHSELTLYENMLRMIRAPVIRKRTKRTEKPDANGTNAKFESIGVETTYCRLTGERWNPLGNNVAYDGSIHRKARVEPLMRSWPVEPFEWPNKRVR